MTDCLKIIQIFVGVDVHIDPHFEEIAKNIINVKLGRFNLKLLSLPNLV